ncbi:MULTISPECIES: hypothetical protein [Nostocales]|jgi:hypothetical protein|nr:MULTISPECIES: hypothetical protein [Nostocales]
MMPNWNAIESSFLRQPHPQQLGELASSLARLKSWCQKNANQEVVPVLLEESLLYIELILRSDYTNDATELTQIQDMLRGWQHNWSIICDNPTETATLAAKAATWSERVLDMSGLLVATDSMSA